MRSDTESEGADDDKDPGSDIGHPLGTNLIARITLHQAPKFALRNSKYQEGENTAITKYENQSSGKQCPSPTDEEYVSIITKKKAKAFQISVNAKEGVRRPDHTMGGCSQRDRCP